MSVGGETGESTRGEVVKTRGCVLMLACDENEGNKCAYIAPLCAK